MSSSILSEAAELSKFLKELSCSIIQTLFTLYASIIKASCNPAADISNSSAKVKVVQVIKVLTFTCTKLRLLPRMAECKAIIIRGATQQSKSSQLPKLLVKIDQGLNTAKTLLI